MNQRLKGQLVRSFKLTHDLVARLDEESLGLDLPNLPSNRISDQLWCIVGARESYTKAIETGGWRGFSSRTVVVTAYRHDPDQWDGTCTKRRGTAGKAPWR